MLFLFFLNLTHLPCVVHQTCSMSLSVTTFLPGPRWRPEKQKADFLWRLSQHWLFITDNPLASPSHSAGLARHLSIVNVAVFLSLPLYHHLTPLSVLIVFFIVFPSLLLSEVSQGRRHLVITFVWSHLMCSFGKCCERGSRVATDARKED